MLQIESHPQLDLRAFVTEFPSPLAHVGDEHLESLRTVNSVAPMRSGDDVRKAVRDLLRHGGFKPTGRNKPASEYLIKATADAPLTTINAAVDTCNVVSLHAGLPISVVDADKLIDPLRVRIAPANTEYVFNPTGQTLKLDGLLCLFDANGPCANAVKDSQRTKTSDKTVRTLTLIWGTNALRGRTEETLSWYQQLLGCIEGLQIHHVEHRLG